MKKILLVVIFILGFAISFSNNISLPNEKVSVVNDTLLYNGSPFTGNIIMNEEDQMDGYLGAISLKNGHLDGLTELRNDGKRQHMKFTAVNGKFDGELIMKDPEQGIDLILSIKKGAIIKYFGNIQGEIEYNLTFKNNLASGTIGGQGELLEFKNGVARGSEGQEIRLSLNPATGDMEMEAIVNGQAVGKQTIPNLLTPQFLESFLFLAITATNN